MFFSKWFIVVEIPRNHLKGPWLLSLQWALCSLLKCVFKSVHLYKAESKFLPSYWKNLTVLSQCQNVRDDILLL